MTHSIGGLVVGAQNRDRILKALVVLLVGASLGAGIGGTITAHVVWSAADDEAEECAYCARCLFRVAERHIGHHHLILEWRAEIRAMRSANAEARQ